MAAHSQIQQRGFTFRNVLIFIDLEWSCEPSREPPTDNVILKLNKYIDFFFFFLMYMPVFDPAQHEKTMKKNTRGSSKSHIKYNRAAFSPGDTLESRRLQ